MKLQKQQWNKSYKNKDNFVFYPHEEVIRFVSRFIRKRTDFDEFTDVFKSATSAKVLDVGCGVGRHVKFLNEYKLDAYGIDLSDLAVSEAHRLFALQGLTGLNNKVIVSGVTETPFSDDFFDFALSHGVFDSMHFDVAKSGMKELHRIVKPGGLVYMDLVSAADGKHAAGFSGEEFVDTAHEADTVQSYFNPDKIAELCAGTFEIIELDLISKLSLKTDGAHARYHIVARNQRA